MVLTDRIVRACAVAFAVVLVVVSSFVGWPTFERPIANRSSGSATSGPPTGGVVAPAFVAGPGVVRTGPMAAGQRLNVEVGLAPRDATGLESAVTLEYTPGSPSFHRYLSTAAVAEKYGPDPAAYSAAEAYFRGFGLTVTESPDRLMFGVAGPSEQVAAAFHTQFSEYRSGDRVFFSHSTSATLPAALPWAGVVGLGNFSPPLPATGPFVRLGPPPAGPSAGCPSGGAPLTPCQIRSAYNLTGFVGSGINGTGYRIGIVDTYDAQENQTSLVSDFASFTATYGLPRGNVRYLYPVPTTRNLNLTYTGWGTEEALDLEWARSVAPGAAIDMTFAPDPTAGLYGSVDWLVAHQAVNVMSLSWGEPDVGFWSGCSFPCNATADGSYGILHSVLQEAAAEGIGVFVASGDCGAADGTTGVATNYPASDPYAVGVGATNLTLNSSNGWVGETGWGGNASAANGGCFNQGGSGGGYSPFPRPWWQAAPGLSAAGSVRAVPDVAANGGTGSPVSIIVNGFSGAASGTSASSPMWAGVEAIADDRAAAALGFLGPSIYQIARGASYGSAFHDVTRGSNGYHAGVGWDAVTGVGTPNAKVLLPLLASTTVARSNLTVLLGATTRFGAAPLSVGFSAQAANGTGTYPMYSIDFGDGNSTSSPNGSATHVYPRAGVYGALAVVFDSAGNSSISTPVAIVVGGGSGLAVRLNATPNRTAVGTPVNLTANVTGGVGPYRFTYEFGDGTYWSNTSRSWANHSYGSAGGYCATVLVQDSRTPVDGGGSSPVAVRIGGAGPPGCRTPSPLNVSLSSTIVAADLPGDFPVRVHLAGGTPPIHLQYVSDDPYVTACSCPIFRTTGNHTLTLFANDSVNQQVVARLNVTLYPALVGQFSSGGLVGPVQNGVAFRANASGGHLADANRTFWTFGDGTNGTGPYVTHAYSAPGVYLVTGNLRDSGSGNASEVFVVDELPALTDRFGVGATVLPAVHTGAGAPVNFSAIVAGSTSAYIVHWDLGANDSAFGGVVEQTYTPTGCLAAGTCPLAVDLNVTFANGTVVSRPLTLPAFLAQRFSGLTLTDTLAPLAGSTPLPFSAAATVSGVAGAQVQWIFGDGNQSVGPTAQHTFYTPGNFTVTEVATDPVGDRLVRTLAVPVAGIPRSPPTVSIQATTPTNGVVPFPAGFTATASGGSGGPYTYTWRFGDGTSGNGTPITHTYVAGGSYAVVVNATDSVGDGASASTNVTIYNVTYVVLGFPGAGSAFLLGSTAAFPISVTPVCTRQSVPNCAAVNVPLQYSFVDLGDPTGTTPWVHVPVPFLLVNGSRYLDIQVPSLSGTYSLVLETAGPAYSGATHLLLNISGTAHATCSGPCAVYSPIALAYALGVAGVIALAVLTVMYSRRARRRRPPAEPERTPPVSP